MKPTENARTAAREVLLQDAARTQTLPATMRLIARMMLLLTLVLGVSVALAWAWDNSDDLAARQAEAGGPVR